MTCQGLLPRRYSVEPDSPSIRGLQWNPQSRAYFKNLFFQLSVGTGDEAIEMKSFLNSKTRGKTPRLAIYAVFVSAKLRRI
jgi:hypothetical protein